MPSVVIIGAGLSGLTVAYRLRQQRPDITLHVLEKAERPGGNIWTDRIDGFQVETGPNGFLDAKPHTLQLCRDLGLGERLIHGSEAARKNRFLFLNGRLQALPSSLWSFITSPLLSWRGKLNLILESFRRRPIGLKGDESVAAFVRRRAGREAAAIFADALVTGIHAGDPERLSMMAAFPRVWQMERQYGSVLKGMSRAARQRRAEAVARGEKPEPGRMWSFREGLRLLVESLRDCIGSSLVTGVAVRGIRFNQSTTRWEVHGDGRDRWEADALVLASPAHAQAPLLDDVDPALAAEVGAIRYNRIVVVALGYREDDVRQTPAGFGFIAPSAQRRDLLGVQWCSSIYPDRAPPGMVLWRALCGGVHRAEMIEWDEDRLISAVRAELRQALGVRAAPVFTRIVRWPRALPQYELGHPERVNRIEGLTAYHRGLYLTGNAYHGVAMNDCVEQGQIVATKLDIGLASR